MFYDQFKFYQILTISSKLQQIAHNQIILCEKIIQQRQIKKHQQNNKQISIIFRTIQRLQMNNNSDHEIDRQMQIERMFLHIGNYLRYVLESISYIFKQNNIDYSLLEKHNQIMRLIAPPYQLLKLPQQYNDENYAYQAKKNQKRQQNLIDSKSIKREDNFQSENLKMNSISKQSLQKINYQNLIKKQDNKPKQDKMRFLVGNNPTGIYGQIKQFGQSKGDLFLKSLKIMRHTKKFTETFQQNQVRKNDPNIIPIRKMRRYMVESDDEYDDIKQKFNMNGRRGRKVQDWVLQQKIYEWVKQQAIKGRRIRKVDIRNQFKAMSGGKFLGSTGWCRRFIQRHPQINSWFTTALANYQKQKVAIFDPTKTQPLNNYVINQASWIQPIQSNIFDYNESQQNNQQYEKDDQQFNYELANKNHEQLVQTQKNTLLYQKKQLQHKLNSCDLQEKESYKY